MKRFLALSFAAHGAFLFFAISVGTLLSRPRMGVYSVDLFSMPSGTPGGGGAAPAVTAAPPVKAEEYQPQAPQPKAPSREAIKIPGKLHKRPPLPKRSPVRPAAKPKPSAHFSEAMRALGMGETSESGSGSGGGNSVGLPGNGGGGGSGIVGEAGGNFPYPWYLKALSERIDHQWHLPPEFSSSMSCRIGFVVHRNGEITDARLEKSSGDSAFDDLALRAVRYVRSAPPLPAGFPDDSLNVHFSFTGKGL